MKTHREILFRGFCPNENGKQIITLGGEDIRGDWVYGDLIHNIDCIKIRERETDINRIAKSYIVIEETVGQYTGIKDRNGKQVWEGDILEVFFDGGIVTGPVYYDEGQWFGAADYLKYDLSNNCGLVIGDKFNTRSVE